MKRIILGAFGSGVLLAVAGCGSSDATERTMTVQGTLTSTTRHTDNARAVAISDTGRKYWAYLSPKGGFTLKVPVGHAYRVVFANQLAAGGQVKIGHVTVQGTNGPTAWVGANRGGATVNLGALKLPTTEATAGSASTQSYGTGGGGGGGGGHGDDDDHSGDYGCHHEASDSAAGGSGYGQNGTATSGYGSSGSSKHDDENDDNDSDYDNNYDHEHEKCDVYEAKGEDVELKPSKEPGSGYGDSKASQHQQQEASGAYGDQRPCTSSQCSGYGSYGGGGSSSSASSTGSATSGSTGGSTGYGSAPSGSACSTTASCTSTCACVASKCQPSAY